MIPARGPRRELFEATLDWSLGFLDRSRHLVWNPSVYDAEVPARTVHLTPNSAWVAHGLLARGDPSSRDEAVSMLERVLALQLRAPGAAFDGTYALFAESAEPDPERAVVWKDYDPNWRQFVGTALGLVLEDHGGALPAKLVERIETSVLRACRGEPEGRIPLDYTNPGLMQAWLLAWCGRRVGDAGLFRRGAALAAALGARFEELGGFDEFNSPTYYGIDLYALGLWRELPPDPTFAELGGRMAAALWAEVMERYHDRLRNWCGPFTRTYGPDATRSATLLGLWHAAVNGMKDAPLPALVPAGEPGETHHGNDVMAGPVIARLASPDLLGAPRRSAVPAAAGRSLAWRVGERRISSWIGERLMLGAEWSARDWLGSPQAAPLTAHWSEPGGVAALWLSGARQVHAVALPSRLEIHEQVGAGEVATDSEPDALGETDSGAGRTGAGIARRVRLLGSGFRPELAGNVIHTSAMRIELLGDVVSLDARPLEGVANPAEVEIVVGLGPATRAGGPALALVFAQATREAEPRRTRRVGCGPGGPAGRRRRPSRRRGGAAPQCDSSVLPAPFAGGDAAASATASRKRRPARDENHRAWPMRNVS